MEPEAEVIAPDASHDSDLRLALTAAALMFLWGLGGYLVIISSTSFNVMHANQAMTLSTQSIFPQGWAFFTKDPNEPGLMVYIRFEDQWELSESGPSSSPQYFKGWQRTARTLGWELSLLANQVPVESWLYCPARVELCLDSLEHSRSINRASNLLASPNICSDVVFVLQRPLPWAWHRTSSESAMPSRVSRLQVSC